MLMTHVDLIEKLLRYANSMVINYLMTDGAFAATTPPSETATSGNSHASDDTLY
jgi:hypothetical protein